MRQGVKDGSPPTFKIPRTRLPEPIIPGMRGWRTSEGWTVLRLHYSADPERVTDRWLQEAVQGYRGGFEGRDWRREMEIDFSAYKGDPVYPLFDAGAAVKPTEYNPHLPLWRGWDFGYRHPAVVWTQLWPDGTLAFLHELYPTLNADETPGLGTSAMAQLVLEETRKRFPGADDLANSAGVFDFCDPAGTQHKDASEYTSIELLSQVGIHPEWSVVGRKSRIAYLRRYIEEPCKFRINPHCVLLIKALTGAYRYPEETSGGADREMPDLGKKVQEEPYIHIIDALEYVAACNLETAYVPERPTRDLKQREKLVGELAEMYLGVGREGEETSKPLESHLEHFLGDFIGNEGDLTDAFRID
jgi:hypothetical protein